MNVYWGYNSVTGKTRKFYYSASMAMEASEKALKRKIKKQAHAFACYAIDAEGKKYF
jgi:hypothetical protein